MSCGEIHRNLLDLQASPRVVCACAAALVATAPKPGIDPAGSAKVRP